ncbi:MAG TPA: hypothetical protein VKA67_08320 [Verrucomicrobiae bacterium]|nr:hypothetical protein [Verrucomicrobiae bacterium]
MKLHFKIWTWIACAGLLLLVSGCSGINTTHSVSPASFFLPGLMQANPPPAAPEPNQPVVGFEKQFAQAN